MFRYAIRRIWTHRPVEGKPQTEYVDVGNNNKDQARAVLRDVQRWDRTAECKIVKVSLPWDGKQTPTLID